MLLRLVLLGGMLSKSCLIFEQIMGLRTYIEMYIYSIIENLYRNVYIYSATENLSRNGMSIYSVIGNLYRNGMPIYSVMFIAVVLMFYNLNGVLHV